MKCSHPQTYDCPTCEEDSSANSNYNIHLLSLDEIVQIMQKVVNEVVHTAIQWILNDVTGEYFYPDPKIFPDIKDDFPDYLSFDAGYKEKCIEWVNIQDFSVNEIFQQVRDYIHLWNLSACTKFTLAVNDKATIIPRKGSRYYLDATFSKPTPACPNPLAVANVHFTAVVPAYLPKHYPVMVMYRFEGYSRQYHTHGRHEVRSKDFQRFFIDSILQRKLSFYSKIFECRHPHVKLRKHPFMVEEPEEEAETQGADSDKSDDFFEDVSRKEQHDVLSLISTLLKK
ncbi:uncharacterized protein LOC114803697 [Zeugodacus cucurbitae]|uniref:Septation ring formation regulator EzrA n=1 Tax=Zeugodacus cucurbitae TaxID=28588 RepID=A0A0A1XHL9_ZEUCU|nr:uncharacterized protein LOC114803697 [Zeugodacus cucurbitae]